MINIVTSSRYKIHKKVISSFGQKKLEEYGVSNKAVLNIAFVGKRKMIEIASTYKHEDVALPVLAFPYKEEQLGEDQLLGEIVLCYPQVVLLAAERNKKLDSMMDELIDHGIKNLLK